MNEQLSTQKWSVAVIGAGAAGLMAAIAASHTGARVLLLDSKEKIGAKILMSGGTRCNITNEQVLVSDFESSSPRFVESILQQYTAEDARLFFKKLGLSLVLEEGGKYFPSTHSGRTVLELLTNEIVALGINLVNPAKVLELSPSGENFQIKTDHGSFCAKKVIMTTGGLSFPATGSDGSGYDLAKTFGHTLVQTSPSLTPLQTDDVMWKKLSGVSLPVKLSFWSAGKRKKSYQGPLLFTHFGFSGPVVLNLSRHWIRSSRSQNEKVVINFLPELSEESLRERVKAFTQRNPNEAVRTFFASLLPVRVVETIFKKNNISESVTLNQFPKHDRERMIKALYHTSISVSGDLGYAKAEVTAGGISLKELNPRTLESNKQSGLYFAGEILDVDGRIGGFNFQWAWSSGYIAGTNAAC